jgi:hypothetical protein
MSVLGLGLWLVNKYIGFDGRISHIFVALVVGVTFFVGALLGMSIDPRASVFGVVKIIKVSGLVGLGAFLFTLIIVAFYTGLIRAFK